MRKRETAERNARRRGLNEKSERERQERQPPTWWCGCGGKHRGPVGASARFTGGRGGGWAGGWVTERAGGRAVGGGGAGRAQRQPCWGESRRQPRARARGQPWRAQRRRCCVGAGGRSRQGPLLGGAKKSACPCTGLGYMAGRWRSCPPLQHCPRRRPAVWAGGLSRVVVADHRASSPSRPPLQAHHSHDPGERPRTLPQSLSARVCWLATHAPRPAPTLPLRWGGRPKRARAGRWDWAGRPRQKPRRHRCTRAREHRQELAGWAPLVEGPSTSAFRRPV